MDPKMDVDNFTANFDEILSQKVLDISQRYFSFSEEYYSLIAQGCNGDNTSNETLFVDYIAVLETKKPVSKQHFQKY